MAQRPNLQAKSVKQKAENFKPDLGLLMQHLQERHNKGTGDNPSSVHINDAQRVFPFQTTPSGNLKIIPNQVVFESKKVSVLVAEPRHAKVNVKAEHQQQPQQQGGRDHHHAIGVTTTARQSQQTQRPAVDLPPGVTASTVDRLQAQRKLPTHVEFTPTFECRPRTQPYNRAKTRPSYMDEKQSECTLSHGLSVISDVPLSTLGFTSEQPIDWKNITLPEKTDLYQELSRRITTYKNADCIIRIGNDEFHCHLLVLQSYSTYLDDKNVKEIDLTGSSVTSRAFSIIYDWMISPTSESCHLLRRDNILEIFLAAQYLGIKELEEQCWAFIDNDELFSEDTAFLLYLEARKMGNTAVMELMVPRIMKFFLMLVSTKDFLELSVEELCLLLRSNYICVNSEMEVLMSAVRWLMHDWDSRKQYLIEVMKCVRFGLIAPWQLVDVKRNPENPEFMELMSYPEIQKMVDDGLAFVIIKYWYGNQTEDYYHWIDLLGLTEPTNRNWAGEDKNYVTYREFLLYLEEYQRTKISELKNKNRNHAKPLPPSSPPKEDSSPQSTSPVRTRTNHQNQKNTEMTCMAINSKPSKQLTDVSGNNGPHTAAATSPCMMLPPEVLGQYLNSIGRNGTKLVCDDAEKSTKSRMDISSMKRFSGGGEFPIKLVKAIRAIEVEKNNSFVIKPIKKEEKSLYKYNNEKLLQSSSKYMHSKQSLTSALDNLTKKFSSIKYTNEKNDSSKLKEKAAITIQAVYRGYKARRKFKEIRKTFMEAKEKAKKIADLLTIPAGLNLHKPLEPIKIASSSSTQTQNEMKDKKNALWLGKTIGESTTIEQNTRADNHIMIITSNLEKSQIKFLQEESIENCHMSNLVETIMSPDYSNINEKASYKTPFNITNPDDNLSLLNEDGSNTSEGIRTLNNSHEINEKLCYSASELHLRRRAKKNELKKLSKCKLLISGSITGGNSKNCFFQDDENEGGNSFECRPFYGEEREAVLVFGGIDPHADYGRKGNSGKDVYRYRPEENIWEFVGEMPEPRHHHSVAYLTGRIYLVGGADPQEDNIQRRNITLGTVWSYDPRIKNWYKEPNMLTPRQNFGLVESDGKIFAIGGQNKNGIALKTVETFDPVTREWKEVRSMHIARIGPASVKYEGHIWVAGGMTKSKRDPLTKDVECYDPSRNIWSKVHPLRSVRCFSCLHVVGNQLFIVGGAGKTSNKDENSVESIGCVDVWDTSLCVWQRRAEISTARHGHAVCSIGDRLIILGGITTLHMRALKSVECYSCERDIWIKGISSLPFAISGHGSVSLPLDVFSDSR